MMKILFRLRLNIYSHSEYTNREKLKGHEWHPYLCPKISDAIPERFLLAHRMSHWLAQTRVGSQFSGLVSGFPGEIRISAPKVPIGRGLEVNRPAKIQRVDDALGRQLEMGPD